MRSIKWLLIAILLAVFAVEFGAPTATQAQGDTNTATPVTFKNPMVYVGPDGNVYMTDEFSGAGQAITGDGGGGPTSQFPFFDRKLGYYGFAWSPDGQMLAFNETYVNKTITVVQSGKAPVVVAKAVDTNFPPAFSPDGKDVAFIVQTPQKGTNDGDLVLQIQAVPATGGDRRAVGSLVGSPWTCGGDMHDADMMNYVQEIGLLGKSPMFFAWLKQGFLHTMGCTGRGLALSDGSKDIWSNPNLQNVALSPDGTQALAILTDPSKDPQDKSPQLNLVDVATGKLTPLTTQPNVDRAIFSADGKLIIYTTAVSSREVKGSETSAVGKQLFADNWPAGGNESTLMVYTMPVAGGNSTPVFKGVGYGFGYLAAAHNKPYAVFSVATSITAMLDRINANDTQENILKAAPHTELIYVFVDAPGIPTLITRGGQPSFSPAAEFSIIPAQPTTAAPTLVSAAPTLVSQPTLASQPTIVIVVPPTATLIPTATPAIILPSGGSCPGFLPSRLHAGQQGQVMPGQSNNLRASPPSGAILKVIPAGAVFDVLDGPVCTNNNIAWWKVNFTGTIGWTAEGQGAFYWLQPFSGIPPTSAPAPSDGSFGIVGVTAHVSPSSASGCPSTFTFTGQIVVNKPGTVTYRWEGSDGSVGSTLTWTASAGGLTKDETLSISASAGGWRKLHVLTPNDISSNQATFTILCGAAMFSVTGVTASVTPNSSTVCPSAMFNFTGQITASAAGTVTYRWERSDGPSSTQSITFGAAGSQTVTDSWQLGAGGTFWEKIHVLTPNDISSNQATFTRSSCP